MGSDGDYRSMLEEFLTASARLQAELGGAVHAGRLGDAERVTHTLKSMARMVGAAGFADACARAEHDAAKGHMPDPAALGRLLADAQAAVQEALA